ncbi:retrovirus-related Pol polyprotein from transposon 412 [Trichonephila clavipes]|nr:retrovirus-related Pol polyprotein from transposon 412 [Trichonephila clavipes]
MKTRYDTKATGHQFKEGDKVWFYNPTRRKGLSPKLQSHWDGPYTILKIINDVVIRIPAGKKWNILLNKSGRIPSSLSQSVGVACFCLLTGHDYLQRHLHCIGVKNSACCPLCYQSEMNDDHLRHCPIVLKFFFVDNSV